jgi:hypothetical protein
MSYCVAIVAHPDFEPLAPLAERVHVWLAETSPNRARAEAYWRAHPQKSIDQGVTTFKVRTTDSPDQMVLGALGAVDLHHGESSHAPPWDTLEIYGADATPLLRKALAYHGISHLHPIPGGFRASRSVGSAA